MALIGYARVSTHEQQAGLEGQIRDLKAAGCDDQHIYKEEVFSVAERRPEWEKCRAFMRSGDTLVITKPDRLARSTRDLLNIIEALRVRGISIYIIGEKIDTRDMTAMMKFHLTILGGVAEFERAIMLERQRDGIAKAKTQGKYKGRKPKARNQTDAIMVLHSEGKGRVEIARELGLDRSSVFRVLAAQGVPSNWSRPKASDETAA